MARVVEMPVWTDACRVSVQEIDAQHRNLFGLAANLGVAVREGKSGQVLLPAFDLLAAYCGEHFQAEEGYMARFSYPGLDEHRAEHARFARKIGYFRRSLDIGKPGVATELLDFLAHWLVHHIQDVDRRYAGCFRENGLT